MKVWKFELDVSARQCIRMPSGAAVLSVGLQGATVCLWAMVDPTAPEEKRTFESYATGQDVSSPGGLRFIGTTVDLSGSPLVFHHFERRRSAGSGSGLI